MAKTIVIRNIVLGLSLLAAVGCSRGFRWESKVMDGSRTGVSACTAEDVESKLGMMVDSFYVAPNGRSFEDGATPAVAAELLAVQPNMADLKRVIAYSPEAMVKDFPESALSNWFVDLLMSETSRLAGKKVDFGIVNFGGIRVDMPQGDVLKDDIVSMFPFKNYLCYLELKGRDIRAILEHLASTRWQVVGGARCVVKDKALVSAEIGGSPLDDNRVYGVATINFLLNGGDGINVAKNALRLVEMKDTYVIDVVLPYVEACGRIGMPIEYGADGRIVYVESDNQEVI